MKIEQWKFIPGFEGLYMVSNFGRAKSLDRITYDNRKIKGTILTPVKRKGYLYVHLRNGSISKHFSVHRLVAMAFIPNPDNLPQVNHRNENKTDNRVENLEWCSCSYNLNYGTRNKKVGSKLRNNKRSKRIIQYTLDGEVVNVYPSLSEIGRCYPFDISAISANCRGKNGSKTAYGYIWRYMD